MESRYGFVKLKPNEFYSWLSVQKVSRSVRLIQLHHTWQPNYSTFNKYPDGFTLQKNMQTFHKNQGWADIGQHFSVFPDGSIITGRSLNKSPAGIVGGNTGAICIENVGNFDKGGDNMTEAQKNAIIILVQSLMKKFGLNTSSIRYHCWYTAGGTYLGDYNPSRSAKTCPGTNFFGGNTKSAFEKNLKPLLEGNVNVVKEEDLPMTAAEKKAFENLQNMVKDLQKQMSEHVQEHHFVYGYIDDNMPDWCKPIVLKAIEVGVLKGVSTDAKGNITNLGLTIHDIKALAFDLREKGYDV